MQYIRAREVATTHSFEATVEAKVDNSFNERDKFHFAKLKGVTSFHISDLMRKYPG